MHRLNPIQKGSTTPILDRPKDPNERVNSKGVGVTMNNSNQFNSCADPKGITASRALKPEVPTEPRDKPPPPRDKTREQRPPRKFKTAVSTDVIGRLTKGCSSLLESTNKPPRPEVITSTKPTTRLKSGDDGVYHSSDSETSSGAEETHRSDTPRIREKRNLVRVAERDRADMHTMSSKYLPSSLHSVFGEPIVGPNDSFQPSPWLIEAIEEVCSHTPVPPLLSDVQFSTNKEAVTANTELLRKHGNDLGTLLQESIGTTLDPSSEFRPLDDLTRVYHNHPNFPFVHKVIKCGMEYKFTKELSHDHRMAELTANLERGNHKSATSEPEKIHQLLEKDVRHGFAIPVLKSSIPALKDAMVQPIGLANQFTLQADGTRVRKGRLTHDLSHSITSPDASVNSRIDLDQHPEMVCGWCLSRIIHFVVALRKQHPTKRILVAKYDFSDAYRRVAHASKAAAQTILTVGNIAYIMLRLSFGGAPNPPTWCGVSEMITDLSNELPLCPTWDPEKLHHPIQPACPEPKYQPDSIDLAHAQPTVYYTPTDVPGRTDAFIDDLVRVFLDDPSTRSRESQAVSLAMYATCRPHAGKNEPLPRRENLSEPKLLAEGRPAEVQIVLGWELDTRRLRLSLPFDKYAAWTSDLNDAVTKGHLTFSELKSMLGRLNHAAYVIPLARHFLGRFYHRIHPRKHNDQQITLSAIEIDDLRLWCKFLQQARDGISLNKLTHQYPSKLCLSDSCPFGLGGFLWTGRAWRLFIPPETAM